MIFSYYPGCSQNSSSVEYDISVRGLFKTLGITLNEIEDWTCCGSSPAHTIDPVLSSALSARNLQLTRDAGSDLVATPCPSCLANLRTAEYKMRDSFFQERVNRLLDAPYTGGVEVKSILRILYEDVSPEEIARRVTNPLPLTIVPYYGCLTTRPGGMASFDDEEDPISMDRLLEAAGATVPEFAFKTECCGASMGTPLLESVTRLSGRILDLAAEAGADAIAVACPLCQLNLDLRREQINKANKTSHTMPVIYITQLLGLALGLSPQDMAMDKLHVSSRQAVAAILRGSKKSGEDV